jgi:electron transfer flavoprotein beta subunit
MAAKLTMPHITQVRKIRELTEDKLVAEKLTDRGYEVVEVPLPAVITVVKELNEPRIPGLRGMMRAKKAEIPVWGPEDIEAEEDRIGLKGSPTQVWRTFEPERQRKGEMLEGTPSEQAADLWQRLKAL